MGILLTIINNVSIYTNSRCLAFTNLQWQGIQNDKVFQTSIMYYNKGVFSYLGNGSD